MNTFKEIKEAKEHVNFQDSHIILKPSSKDLPTLEDTDQTKLPHLEKLLLQMYELVRELKTVNIKIKEFENYGNKWKGYKLTIPDYSDSSDFIIKLESRWFDVDNSCALHAGFGLFIYINQQIHPEIGDWVKIDIKHFPTRPFSFASMREYSGNRYLGAFYSDKKFFDNFDFGPEKRSFLDKGEDFTFQTKAFIKSIDDACVLLEFISKNKNVIKEKESV